MSSYAVIGKYETCSQVGWLQPIMEVAEGDVRQCWCGFVYPALRIFL